MKTAPLYNIHKMVNERPHPMRHMEALRRRLLRIGIDIELKSNMPWLYLSRVDGKHVKERFLAEHGFCIAFLEYSDEGSTAKLTDIKEIFKVIRKYNKSFKKPHI